MKDVETTTAPPLVILVTGFGAFPGAPRNPSAAILDRLVRHGPRLAHLGIRLETTLLPVVFDRVGATMQAVARVTKPEAVLHIGLAGRRRAIGIEMRAINRAGPLHPDAAGRRADQIIAPGGPTKIMATYPAARLTAAIQATGASARRSIDAGDYVCNTTLYLTLLHHLAPRAGFLHVPKIRAAGTPRARVRRQRPTLETLTRGVLAAVLVLAREVRRDWEAARSRPSRHPKDVA